MATLNLKSIATFVSIQAAAMQAATTTLLDFSVGSVFLALVKANAAVGMWLQSLILQVLAVSRLATSFGPDVDSFIADFDLKRLQPSGSAGQVTFSRFTSTFAAFIPVGTTVQTAGGAQVFTVGADPTNAAFSAPANGFILAAGVPSLTVTVVSASTGTAANVAAGTVNVLTQAISGVDSVSNAAPFTGGASGETDPAVKVRFPINILGRQDGTAFGAEAALANLNVSISFTLTDQMNYAGQFQAGYYYFVVDDGTGFPSAAFLNAATAALLAVKPLGVWFGVFAPIITRANVSLILSIDPGFTASAVIAQVSAMIANNITALGLGAGLQQTQIANWAWSVLGVTGVTAITLQGVSGDPGDIAPNNQVRILPNNISVSQG